MNSDAPDWHEKDSILNELAKQHNIAQFVSFAGISQQQRHAWIIGYLPNHCFSDLRDAISCLFQKSADGSVNVRTFRPGVGRGAPFFYGIKTVDEAVARSTMLLESGWNVIANETIEVNDGGVSGVAFGDAIEFAPEDTPRCVEKPDCCHLPRTMGLAVLKTVYGFDVDLPKGDDDSRIEFSIHPIRRGLRRTHTILWQAEHATVAPTASLVRWPNRFSQFIGDKVFGLLVANCIGLPVPAATVLARNVRPFSFGQSTGTGEVWVRSAPNRQDPGRFTTHFGWNDPFKMMAVDNDISSSASVSNAVERTEVVAYISQESVDAEFSGAAAVTEGGNVVTEGVQGFGAHFMLGSAPASALPMGVAEKVRQLVESAANTLGSLRMEWAFDGNSIWVLQLHVGAVSQRPDVIVKGEAGHWIEFDVSEGLPKLRDVIANLLADTGIILIGNVGITSHFGDLLRLRKIPSRLRRDGAGVPEVGQLKK